MIHKTTPQNQLHPEWKRGPWSIVDNGRQSLIECQMRFAFYNWRKGRTRRFDEKRWIKHFFLSFRRLCRCRRPLHAPWPLSYPPPKLLHPPPRRSYLITRTPSGVPNSSFLFLTEYHLRAGPWVSPPITTGMEYDTVRVPFHRRQPRFSTRVRQKNLLNLALIKLDISIPFLRIKNSNRIVSIFLLLIRKMISLRFAFPFRYLDISLIKKDFFPYFWSPFNGYINSQWKSM